MSVLYGPANTIVRLLFESVTRAIGVGVALGDQESRRSFLVPQPLPERLRARCLHTLLRVLADQPQDTVSA